MTHEYEIVFILRPDLDEADANKAIERIEASISEQEGHLLDRDDWGVRKLAYLIHKHAKGHYVLLRVACVPAAILEIERKMRLDDRIIRFLTVNVAKDVDVDLRVEQAEALRKEREVEAARRAAEAEARAADNDDDDDDDDSDDS